MAVSCPLQHGNGIKKIHVRIPQQVIFAALPVSIGINSNSFDMKRNKFIILILVFTLTYLAGRQLQSIYGFDPPYFYFYFGFSLELLSILGGFIAVIFWVINRIKKQRLN